MLKQGKYISFLMLAAFLFPQAANAVHYFLVPHIEYTSKQADYNFDAPGIYEYHECHYHFTGTGPAFMVADTAEKIIIPEIHLQQHKPYSTTHILKLNYRYFLRGPPSAIFQLIRY
ncbi:hypothetical protein [Salinimicrobium xinjiangense]|uniref:hypothetical protein n=1 Tax=Salinimicrobium xinjiangense TaxID=438596 RepID=UPI000413EF1E|nr:hypothetical protein [Salinimicrobium xinjiangense]